MKKILLLFFISSFILFAQVYDLMKAIENNDLETVKIILRDGINIDFFDYKYNMSPISYAASNGNLDILREIIKFGAKDYDRALFVACKEGNWESAKELIDAGATNLDLALSYASISGNLIIVRELIDLGAKDFKGALIAAAEGNSLEVVKELIGLGANVNYYGYVKSYSDYRSGVRKYPITATGSVDIIRELINSGATNINEAFIERIRSSDFDIDLVNELANLGANVNYYNRGDGKTILMYAIENKNVSKNFIKTLIDIGADVNAKDFSGNTVLMRAVKVRYDITKKYGANNGVSVDLIEELLKAGADIEAFNNYGNTAYGMAANRGRKDIIELFDRYDEK